MSLEHVKQDIIWVDSNSYLEELCEQWREEPYLAIDTEFMRSQTYYPIAGLIQLNDGKANYLIDPQAITDFFPLIDVFDNENCVLFLHSCSEDLEVFQHALGCIPHRIIDTQIACAMAGYGFSVGYAKAIEANLGVSLPKAETRSDWLLRPLSQAQLNYAALDVEYLYQLGVKLKDQLSEQGRWSWLIDDCDEIAKNYKQSQVPGSSYLRIKSAWRLNSQQLAILKALAEWRETKAQIRDKPRNRIVKENALLEIAKRQPSALAQLRNIEGITERMIKTDGQTWLQLVDASKKIPSDELPDILPQPLSSEQNTYLKHIRSQVEMRAQELKIPSELILKKKTYEAIIRQASKGEKVDVSLFVKGWRYELVNSIILEQIAQLSW